jgi:hypothetical protein
MVHFYLVKDTKGQDWYIGLEGDLNECQEALGQFGKISKLVCSKNPTRRTTGTRSLTKAVSIRAARLVGPGFVRNLLKQEYYNEQAQCTT